MVARAGNSMSDDWAQSVAPKPAQPGIVVRIEPLLIDKKGASKMMGVSERTMQTLADEGVVETRRIRARKLFVVSSLKALANGGKEVC